MHWREWRRRRGVLWVNVLTNPVKNVARKRMALDRKWRRQPAKSWSIVVALKAVKSWPLNLVANKVYPLKRSSNFKEAALSGKKQRLASWVTLHIIDSSDSKNYFGITASGKVGNAIIRNKLKRWVRNCVRTEQWPAKLQSKTIVFVFRPQSNESFYSALKFKEFLELYKKI